MLKYCNIANEEIGLVDIATGENENFYQEIGMKKLDVELSEVDNQWYLSDLCPHKSEEEKLKEAKEKKYQEALDKANSFLNTEALFELTENFHVEATKENANTLTSASVAIDKGIIETQVWTSKEDNVLYLTQEQCMTISFGIGAIQGDVWSRQFINYKNAIDNALTIEEVEAIVINYKEGAKDGL